MTAIRVPTVAKAAAPFIGWGVFLTLAGLPVVLGASTLVGLQEDPVPVVWAGLVTSILGAVLLATGLYRWAQHVDRDAGVKAGYAAGPE